MSKGLCGSRDIPGDVNPVPRNRAWWPVLGLLTLCLLLLITPANAENTPPSVEVTTPTEGSVLGLAVTVSGKATDAEGFNIDSYVEARWNDWEWFRLPNTPADGNRSIVFGEMVNLDWHSPGEHTLQVRAFDGELYSGVEEVTVTVRDLPDLVVLPEDIAMEPVDVREGEKANISVVVRNQGGEAVSDVEVVLHLNGELVDSLVLDVVPARSQATPSFLVGPGEGNNTFRGSALARGAVEERSETNNMAERSFIVREAVLENGWDTPLLVRGGVILAVAVVLLATYAHAVVSSRKD